MYLEIILSMLSLGAALVGAVGTIGLLCRKSKADRRFLELLTTGDAARELRQLRSRIMRNGVMTSAELQEVVTSLERWTDKLPESDRRLIVQGLCQNSILGRARYAAKWMDKVGIEMGRFAVALR